MSQWIQAMTMLAMLSCSIETVHKLICLRYLNKNLCFQIFHSKLKICHNLKYSSIKITHLLYSVTRVRTLLRICLEEMLRGNCYHTYLDTRYWTCMMRMKTRHLWCCVPTMAPFIWNRFRLLSILKFLSGRLLKMICMPRWIFSKTKMGVSYWLLFAIMTFTLM